MSLASRIQVRTHGRGVKRCQQIRYTLTVDQLRGVAANAAKTPQSSKSVCGVLGTMASVYYAFHFLALVLSAYLPHR